MNDQSKPGFCAAIGRRHSKSTSTELKVEGTIPPELNGVYLRTGPNPASGTGDHWFLGDGMVHGIRLRTVMPSGTVTALCRPRTLPIH